MPKTKKLESESSDDSDSSGPQDRNPPSKKAKSESAPASKSGGSSSSKSKGDKKGGEDEWVLDKKRVVKINEFRGTILVDIREYYEDKAGDLKPTKKGISLSGTQWQKLKEIIPEIDDALKKH